MILSRIARELLFVCGLLLFASCGGSSSKEESVASEDAQIDASRPSDDEANNDVDTSDNADVARTQTGETVGGGMPCEVATALVRNCQKCHGVNPAFGAPMPLVKLSDLKSPAKSDSTLSVGELAQKRLHDKAKPMPPGAAISDEDKQTLDDWFEQGMPVAQGAPKPCYTGAPTHDDAYFKEGLTPKDGETCYNFTSHNGQSPDDTEAYSVRPGEHYEQFYFKVPWGKDVVMTRFGGKFDNLPVLHHWLLFTSARPASADGTHETSSGTTLGDSAELIGGWAVGGDNVEFPDDMGLELPADGMLNAQWHFYNQGSEAALDSSSIQVCTAPRDQRENIASLTFLGTENLGGFLGMPAHQVTDYSGSCLNRSQGPITIWGFTPHMHQLGRNMRVTVKRKDGSMEVPFDKAFDFNSQITYPAVPPIVLQPGDTIISTCTFDNDTNAAVPFGPSTNQEMCYNFTMAYPAHALDNGVLSLIGAENTCW